MGSSGEGQACRSRELLDVARVAYKAVFQGEGGNLGVPVVHRGNVLGVGTYGLVNVQLPSRGDLQRENLPVLIDALRGCVQHIARRMLDQERRIGPDRDKPGGEHSWIHVLAGMTVHLSVGGLVNKSNARRLRE
eukprot:scaffold823_cov397-Prasinococcus_capsulatus_cf.AAC.22